MEVADPTIPGLSPPNPAIVVRLLLTLLFLPVAGLARIWDLRSYTGTMLAILSGRERASSQRYTERFLARLAVLATWDIRSENWPVVHDGASIFAKACEMRVQSTRFILLVFSGHAPIFTKERFSWCFVCSSS
jgi:hypothetical protein